MRILNNSVLPDFLGRQGPKAQTQSSISLSFHPISLIQWAGKLARFELQTRAWHGNWGQHFGPGMPCWVTWGMCQIRPLLKLKATINSTRASFMSIFRAFSCLGTRVFAGYNRRDIKSNILSAQPSLHLLSGQKRHSSICQLCVSDRHSHSAVTSIISQPLFLFV